MNFRKLRTYCTRLLADLEIPSSSTVEDLCAQIADSRGRDIYLHPLPQRPVAAIACGVWLATPNADHIFFEDNTSQLHRDHIILHEIGHILCDHRLSESIGDELVEGLVALFDESQVQQALTRSGYTEEQEQVAEMMATLIRDLAALPAQTSPGILGQWELGLGYRRGR